MHVEPSRLSMKAIESTPEIGAWLGQFPSERVSAAKNLLLQLRFVDENCYANWFSEEIASLPQGDRYALYSVRKFAEVQTLWDVGPNGNTVARPGHSLGSEDFVCSLIGRAVRTRRDKLFDHPSLVEIRQNRIHNFMLIDDGIGSGDRIVGFIKAMMNHKSFMSWWSYGFVKIQIASFFRMRQSEAKIISSLPGLDHPKRKFSKFSKISFSSDTVYIGNAPELHWGENHQAIYDLCNVTAQIPNSYRIGYGKVMSNWIFQHSVPNNLPGMLWYSCEKWHPLFPNRSAPGWLRALLGETGTKNSISQNAVSIGQLPFGLPTNLLALLALVKRGVRRTTSLALRLSCDGKRVALLIDRARNLGLLNEHLRLTKVGIDQLAKANTTMKPRNWNRSLYIPRSWCVGREFVQPPVTEEVIPEEPAHSVEVYSSTDGDLG